MARPLLILAVLTAASGLGAGACRIAPPLKVAGEVTWSEASAAAGPGQNDELRVSAGDIVRFDTDAPVRVAEVIRSDEGEADVWQTLVPEHGAALIRAGLFTSGIRASHDVLRGVHTGSARKPEFAWFELESNAVAWAESPLGTSFPVLAAAKRFDASGFAELDEALGAAFHDAPGSDLARDVTRAVRTLAALRAVHTLEGLRGFPYALNRDLPLATTATPRVIETRKYVLADPAHPIPVHVSGPIELFVWARIPRAKADAEVVVRVTEGGHLRASTKGLIRRELDQDPPDGSDLSQLRHVLVHVPPGEHDYTIEPQGTPAYVSAELSQPAARLEHVFASSWHEGPLLEEAKRSCRPASFGPACALALALAGEEGRPEFSRAFALANEVSKRVTDRLSQGGPGDFAAILESRAMSGDAAAETEVAEAAEDTVDQSFHDAWKRSTLRSTFWEPASKAVASSQAASRGGSKWLTFAPNPKNGAACSDAGGLGSRREVSSSPVSLRTVPWRRAHALDLVAVAPCEGDPIRLEVDGQTLVAVPGEPRALWHIVVKGETAEVRRLDQGAGHVYSLDNGECSAIVETSAAPERLDAPRTLSFPKEAAALGLEVWALAGRGDTTVTVHSRDGQKTLAVETRPKAGLVAIDEQGLSWMRAARVPLPTWAKDGITVEGQPTAAVRALVRQERAGRAPSNVANPGEVTYASAPDEKEILELSRRIATATEPRVRAGLFARRALLLASYGAQAAALEDAESAVALGGTGEKGDDLALAVRRAVRPMAPRAVDLAVAAYGLEPDFDAHAPRCSRGAGGPRAEIAALDALLRERPPDAAFDPELAVRTIRAIAAAPGDPRATSLEHLALRGSSWRLLRDLSGGAGRVPRPLISTRDRIFDPEGRLRPDLAAGRPLGEDYVTVSADAPARALLTGGGPKVRLDVVCNARHLGKSREGCPFTYAIGTGAPRVLSVPLGQITPVELPDPRGRPTLVLSLPPSDSDYTALVRVVFERPIEGTERIADVGWVLKTPHTQHRTLITPSRPARVEVKGPEVIRVDARLETGGAADVVASVDGHDVGVPTDGEPVLLAVPAGGKVVVAVRSGQATIAVAQRVPGDTVVAPVAEEVPHPPVAGAVTLGFSGGRWQEVARRSPPPLSWAADRLGTFEADTGVSAASLREGATSTTGVGVDAYFFENLAYRRRIEAPNLYTIAGTSIRLRNGPPTLGAEAGFYEDLDRYRLRLTGTATGFTQTVQGESAYTLQGQGFLEYSGRIRPDFFILPRLGYDGFYTTLKTPPPSTVNVDDDVYDPFRYIRRTLLFLQGLFWYCPHFNDIYYLRVRADYDATNNAFSHASALPGVLLIFHQAEIQLIADVEYFAATPTVRPNAGVDVLVGEDFIWHAVVVPGSFEFRPTISSQLRLNDQTWQVSAGINILLSARRGMRDYSSLELEFPEETAGGIPWRTETRAGP